MADIIFIHGLVQHVHMLCSLSELIGATVSSNMLFSNSHTALHYSTQTYSCNLLHASDHVYTEKLSTVLHLYTGR